MIHTLRLGVAASKALDFWQPRLLSAGHSVHRVGSRLSFRDPDGLALELVVAPPGNLPLAAFHPGVPAAHAITAVVGARAYATEGEEPALLTTTLGFDTVPGGFRLHGERHFDWGYDPPPPGEAAVGRSGAGTVHHIAWSVRDEDHLAWRDRIAATGTSITEVRDRAYFRSVYFQGPHGVMFELATRSPGFATDEPPEHLGETLCLPAREERLRPGLVRALSPVTNPRSGRAVPVG